MSLWAEIDDVFVELANDANEENTPQLILTNPDYGSFPDNYLLKIINEGKGALRLYSISLEVRPGHEDNFNDKITLQDIPLTFPRDIDDEDDLSFQILYSKDGLTRSRIKIETNEDDVDNNPFYVNLEGDYC